MGNRINLGNIVCQIQEKHGIGISILRGALSGVASIYSLCVVFREIGFSYGVLSSHKFSVPVVSLGNITTGGTGKTPAAVWMVRKLRAIQNRKPVLVSRGYGADEARMIQQILPDTPHFIHRKRKIAGLQAIQEYGENICLVLDDGFQHRRVWRDLDIVLIDATNPFGFGYLLPRGFLREPLSHLRRAHVIILTRCDLVIDEALGKIQDTICSYTDAIQIKSAHVAQSIREMKSQEAQKVGQVMPLAFLMGKRVLAFAGIGNPGSFQAILKGLQTDVVDFCPYPDHYSYQQADIDSLCVRAKQIHADGLITTAKDAVKLEKLKLYSTPVWILDIEFQILDGETALEKMILEKMT